MKCSHQCGTLAFRKSPSSTYCALYSHYTKFRRTPNIIHMVRLAPFGLRPSSPYSILRILVAHDLLSLNVQTTNLHQEYIDQSILATCHVSARSTSSAHCIRESGFKFWAMTGSCYHHSEVLSFVLSFWQSRRPGNNEEDRRTLRSTFVPNYTIFLVRSV